MATLKSTYQDLSTKREAPLRRARRAAELTIPSIMPPDGHNDTTDLPEPYQGVGARGIVHLAAKLMTALIPTGQPFFKLRIPLELLVQSQQESVPVDMQKSLAQAEKMIMEEVENAGWRQPTNMTLQHLLVTGNVIEFLNDDGTINIFRLDQFVVQRDILGNLVKIIIKQSVHPSTVGQAAQGLLTPESSSHGANDMIDVFTGAEINDNGMWQVRQEINDEIVPNSAREYDRNRFLVLRYTSVPGSDYGRSKIEEHIGDLRSLEGLSKALLELAAMNARNLVLVRPNATGKNLQRFVEEAENGAVGNGHADDVSMLQFENIAGAQQIASEIQRLTEGLSAAFLMNSGLRRDAERVTKFELQLVAEELEGGLGGAFSQLSEDMMRPRLTNLIESMENAGRLPEISDVVEPQIIVGLEALGRQKDASRVQLVLQGLQGLPPETLDYVKWEDLLKKLFIGLDLPAAVRTDAEVQGIREQRAQAQALAQAQNPQQPQEAEQPGA